MARRAGVDIETTAYIKFKGVDFSTEPALVASYRSPLATNMIAGLDGRPEKRPGWRTLFNFSSGDAHPNINGLWSGVIDGIRHTVAHVGTELYEWNEAAETTALLMTGLADRVSAGTYFGGKLWICAGKYICYDGAQAQEVCETGYIPTTTIAREPSGGGTSYEAVNMASRFRKNAFQTDGSSKTFQVDTAGIDISFTANKEIPVQTYILAGQTVTKRYYYISGGKCFSYIPTSAAPTGTEIRFLFSKEKVLVGSDEYEMKETSAAQANWLALSGYTKIDAEKSAVTAEVWGAEETDFTVDYAAGKVTFTTAPAAPAAGSADGLVICFPRWDDEYLKKINNCTIIAAYGVGNSDRLVFSGNPDYANMDWTSALDDPTYIPDLSYNVTGIDGVGIMGYARVGSELAIVKEDNGLDSTVFMRSGSLSEDNEAIFTTKQAQAGVGAVSRRSFAMLLDEPLFLSGTGIYALTTNVVTSQKIVQNRSFYVDAALAEEENLSEACAVAYKGMYLLSVNGHVYILDGRQEKTYRSESLGDFVYECYYWENVPVRCWLNIKNGAEESLYFGTADGRICRFNTDVEGLTKYADDEAAVTAVWATKADDDGDPTLLKTMIKKGCAVTLKPYTRSSAKICFRTDRNAAEWLAGFQEITGFADIFDWEDIDFSRFSFNANDGPQEVLFRTKIKKYKRLQIIIRNDAINEGFGIYGITKHYVVGNFAKR